MKTYLIIERFQPGKIRELYTRFEQKGRMLPDGVRYLDSWIDEPVKRCYQLMESESLEALQAWVRKWEDLATFDIIPVLNSAQAKQKALASPDQINEKAIRKATSEDCWAISQVLLAAFRSYQSLYTPQAFAVTTVNPREVARRMTEGPVWVALVDEKVVGTVSALPKDKHLHIRGMGVHPLASGQGLGFLLLQSLEQFARESGFRSLGLSTTPYLKSAIRLYETFGFHIVNERPYDLHGTPLFNMYKALP